MQDVIPFDEFLSFTFGFAKNSKRGPNQLDPPSYCSCSCYFDKKRLKTLLGLIFITVWKRWKIGFPIMAEILPIRRKTYPITQFLNKPFQINRMLDCYIFNRPRIWQYLCPLLLFKCTISCYGSYLIYIVCFINKFRKKREKKIFWSLWKQIE